MFLIECALEARPADFLLLAQNPTNYMCLGFSATGSEYAGDFSGYQARVGASNVLGTYNMTDPDNPVLVTTNQTVRDQFNNAQDDLRRKAYKEEADYLLSEAWRHEIDPSSDATQRQSRKTTAIAKVNEIKARYPKV